MVEVDEDSVGPEVSLKLLATDYLAMTFQQNVENLKRSALQFDLKTVLAQLTRPLIELEVAEAHHT
jgi:predicted TIM-barrel fold metal-dependent hydrolase